MPADADLGARPAPAAAHFPADAPTGLHGLAIGGARDSCVFVSSRYHPDTPAPLVLLQGTHDPILPIDLCSRRIVRQLRAAGYPLRYEALDSSRTKCELKCPNVIMESTIGIGQAARLVGATLKTLQRWTRERRLVPAARTASNRRRYTESQLCAALESEHVAGAPDQD